MSPSDVLKASVANLLGVRSSDFGKDLKQPACSLCGVEPVEVAGETCVYCKEGDVA